MKKLSITKSGVLTNQASFETQEELDAWLNKHIGMGSFGAPRYETQSVEIVPSTQDEEGTELTPAVFEDQQVEINPTGYEVSVVDISAQLEQEAVNAAALKYLSETDWLILRELDSGIPCPTDIKSARQTARDSIS
jgi:hypothetical protein